MSLSVLYSRARSGINAPLVTVEVHLSNGLPSLSIVGLAETAVKESKDRVRGALLNSQFEFPARRITINLAPADLPKEGGRFDLAIALGILAASGQIPANVLDHYEVIGELALSGELRPIKGVLPAALAASRAERSLILPWGNANEAALIEHLRVLPARHLLDVCRHLIQGNGIEPWEQVPLHNNRDGVPDLAEVKGQPHAKRALEIAAAGRHNLLMSGPPGCGKSMLASRLPGILPSMNVEEALESASIFSISTKGFHPKQWRQRPFRSPHHSASAAALVGGGSNPRPGEISLAHMGILFLDELPEFDRKVLEVLREPLETGQITISRAARQEDFPARFQLIAAMNPCPCGFLGDTGPKQCRCTEEQVARYRNKISGPLMDRIDMHIEVPRLPPSIWNNGSDNNADSGESSATVRARVERAWQLQHLRSGCANALLQGKALEQHCALKETSQQLLQRAIEQLGLSARAYHRILRLARTIADLEHSEIIGSNHITEAIGYRRFDRK